MALSASHLTPDLAARKQRWIDFYDFNSPRQHRFLIHYLPELGERPWPTPGNIPVRIEWAWKKYSLMLARSAWLDDDCLPYLDMYTGTEIFAAAFGCQVHYPENDMPFALPLIHSAAEVAELKVPGLDSPAIAPLFAAADELRRRAGPDALLRMVDLQSPMDIAALIWEKTSFYPALIEAPEAVFELAEKVRLFLTSFLDEWFHRFGPEFIAHYPDYYMPYGITLSEDEIGVVSPGVFEEFFLPELIGLSNRYGQIGIHCCAHARHQWPGLLRIPALRLLNLNQPGSVLRQSVDFFANSVAQWPIFPEEGLTYDSPVDVPGPARIVFEYSAASRDEAMAIVERMRMNE